MEKLLSSDTMYCQRSKQGVFSPTIPTIGKTLLSRGLCHKNPSLSMTYQIVQCPLRGRLSTNFMLWRMTDLMKMISTEIFSNDI